MQNKKEIVEAKERSLGKQQRVKLEQWHTILNKDPNREMIKKHPFGGFEYLPIDHIETLLDKFFPAWGIENLQYQLLVNALTVSLELVVILFGDDMQPMRIKKAGVGACALQLNKDVKNFSIEEMKLNAIEIALPVARTRAIKNASQSLGKIFGRSLNRDIQDTYSGFIKEEEKKEKIFN